MGAVKRDVKFQKDIDPIYLEYLPLVSGKKSKLQPQLLASLDDENVVFTSFMADLGSLSIKGSMVWLTGGVSLLRYTKTFSQVVIDLRNGSLDSIIRRTFKNTTFAPRIKNIQRLVAQGHDEMALSLLDNVLVDLEIINDIDIRSSLNVLRAKIHFKNGRFLAAALYYMEAATLTSSQKNQKSGEGPDHALINKTGYLYLISLQSLSAHFKNYELDENFLYLITDLVKRATTLFEKEAQNREIDKYHFRKTGELVLGSIKLPYGWFVEDTKSAELNRKLALEIQKITALIEKRDLIKDLKNYIKTGQYKEEDLEFLLEVAEQISQSLAVTYLEATDFFEFLKQKILNTANDKDSLSYIEILMIQLRLQEGKCGERDILMIIKLLDREKHKESSFLHLLAIADKISTQLPVVMRKDFADIMAEKNYDFMPEIQRECYKKIKDHALTSYNHELNCIYPANVTQFRESLQKLEVKDHAILYRGRIEILSHQHFIELVVRKTKSLLPDEDLEEFNYLLKRNLSSQLSMPTAKDSIAVVAKSIIQEFDLNEKVKKQLKKAMNRQVTIGISQSSAKRNFINSVIGKEVLDSHILGLGVPITIRRSLSNKILAHLVNGTIQAFEKQEEIAKIEILTECDLPEGTEILCLEVTSNEDADVMFENELMQKELEVYSSSELLRKIGDKILIQRNDLLIKLLKKELNDNYQKLQEILKNTAIEGSQLQQEAENSIGDWKLSIEGLETELSYLFKKALYFLDKLKSLESEVMAGKALANLVIDKTSHKMDDLKMALDACEKVFKEETAFVESMNEDFIQLSNALDNFASRKGLDLGASVPQETAPEKLVFRGNLSDNVLHVFSKMLKPEETLKKECVNILKLMINEEIHKKSLEYKIILSKKELFTSIVNEKINHLEDSLVFFKEDFHQRTIYCHSQIEICEAYLSIINYKG